MKYGDGGSKNMNLSKWRRPNPEYRRGKGDLGGISTLSAQMEESVEGSGDVWVEQDDGAGLL